MEKVTNIYDVVASVSILVLTLIALAIFIIGFVRYDLIRTQKQKDYLNNLDNEHDKSVILDYRNASNLGIREYLHYRYYERRARKENKKYDK